jgi:hypothetical protein
MATLTATVTDSVTLNGSVRGSTNTVSVDNITNVFERILTAAASNTTTIATFNSTPHGSAGALDLENCKYIRVTNISSTAVMDLAIVTENTNYQVVLPAGYSHVLAQADTAVIAEADTTPNFPTLEDITSIQVRPRGADDVEVEIFAGLL